MPWQRITRAWWRKNLFYWAFPNHMMQWSCPSRVCRNELKELSGLCRPFCGVEISAAGFNHSKENIRAHISLPDSGFFTGKPTRHQLKLFRNFRKAPFHFQYTKPAVRIRYSNIHITSATYRFKTISASSIALVNSWLSSLIIRLQTHH